MQSTAPIEYYLIALKKARKVLIKNACISRGVSNDFQLVCCAGIYRCHSQVKQRLYNVYVLRLPNDLVCLGKAHAAMAKTTTITKRH